MNSKLGTLIRVEPATPERWSDAAILFEGDGPRGCWCQYWRQSSSGFSAGGPGTGERRLQAQVDGGPPPPGLIASSARPSGAPTRCPSAPLTPASGIVSTFAWLSFY